MGGCTSAPRVSALAAAVEALPSAAAPSGDILSVARAAPSSDAPSITRAQFILSNRGPLGNSYAQNTGTGKLGEGAVGFVCKASHKTTGAARAVKKISISDIDAFRQEVTHMKSMDHPNIIRLHETFEDRQSVYLVMELCEGGDLFDRIIQSDRLPEKDACTVMLGVLRAVRYMNGKDIAHRDLKPENFLLATKGPVAQSVVKLIDFGTARGCRKSQVMTSKVGTAFYMSPQVLQRRYSRECDMWSAGVMMFVMLSGSLPFPGKTDEQVFMRVRTGAYSFGSSVWNTVSEDAKALIRRLLQMNPRSRTTAEEALDSAWIQQAEGSCSSSDQVSLDEDAVEQLGSYNSQNKLKKSALQVIAGLFDDKRLAHLREQFYKLDANGDGVLTAQEMTQGMRQAGIERTASQVHRLISSVDANGNGSIDYTEFLAAALDRTVYLDKQMCWLAFNVFDRNGDGAISAQELAAVLGGENSWNGGSRAVEAQHIAELVKEVDLDGDGHISFKEFMAMMSAQEQEVPPASGSAAFGGA